MGWASNRDGHDGREQDGLGTAAGGQASADGNIGMTAVARPPNVRVMNAGAAWRLKIASAAGLIAHARANPEQLGRRTSTLTT